MLANKTNEAIQYVFRTRLIQSSLLLFYDEQKNRTIQFIKDPLYDLLKGQLQLMNEIKQ